MLLLLDCGHADRYDVDPQLLTIGSRMLCHECRLEHRVTRIGPPLPHQHDYAPEYDTKTSFWGP